MKFKVEKDALLMVKGKIKSFTKGDYESTDKDEIASLEGCKFAKKVDGRKKSED